MATADLARVAHEASPDVNPESNPDTGSPKKGKLEFKEYGIKKKPDDGKLKFKCLKCGSKHKTHKEVNTHYRDMHEPLMCGTCINCSALHHH